MSATARICCCCACNPYISFELMWNVDNHRLLNWDTPHLIFLTFTSIQNKDNTFMFKESEKARLKLLHYSIFVNSLHKQLTFSPLYTASSKVFLHAKFLTSFAKGQKTRQLKQTIICLELLSWTRRRYQWDIRTVCEADFLKCCALVCALANIIWVDCGHLNLREFTDRKETLLENIGEVVFAPYEDL